MEENTKARLRRHTGLVTVGAVFVVVFGTRGLLDLFADWPTAAEWLVAVALAVITGWAVGAWLRNPGAGAGTVD
ncbi:hypothetical protein [Corynebacterium halotolerans]|uniref:Uncharacterized protein n=1 Tax=Corynebacterium halotolerans YIM 70093 = DSM 44683 TaxID=1121362 RepID=M1NN98_9CORY|nr:hypothetical protein [Corynebacterium halotolerans]AGF72838.1 hypothetical protein A605_09180 [Corynebacterium halotolerans YIM 70093 = DSM 44683]